MYLIGQYYYLHFANGEVEAHEVPISCSPSRDRVETGNTCAFCMLPIRSPSYTAGHTCTSVHAAHQDSLLRLVMDLLCACKAVKLGVWHGGIRVL